MGFEDRQYTRDDYSPYGNERTGMARYSIVVILIAINFIVWFADMFSPRVIDEVVGNKKVVIHWLNYYLSLDASQPWRIWTFLTYGFAHSSIEESPLHILMNMFILFIFGRPVSQRLGRYEFLRFYLTAIVFSGVAFFLIRLLTGQPGGAVGASGATMALLILFIVWYPDQKLSLMGLVEVPAWGLGAAMIAYNFILALFPNSGIAWEAHLGGAAFGFLYFKQQWNLGWMSSLTEWVPKPKSKLNVYDPDADADSSKPDKLSEEGDRILAKISEQGEESLTRKERKTLERYSKSIRKRK